MHTDQSRSRLGALALALSSLLFAVFPLVRPYFALDVFSPDLGAIASGPISSRSWLVSHLLLTVAFAALPAGLLAIGAALDRTADDRRVWRATTCGVIGSALVMPMVGVETFAMPQIVGLYIHHGADVTPILVQVYRGPGTLVMIAGLILLAAGGVGLAQSMKHTGVLPRWAGVVFAVGLALWLPLFPRPIRVVDGLLIGVGGVALAIALWRAASGRDIPSIERPTVAVAAIGR